MPIFLFEDESTKLGKRQLILPNNLVDHLKQQSTIYSDNVYKKSKGYKRLTGLLNKSYNDPENKKQSQHNNHTISFADAKRMDFDIRHMQQNNDNVEYAMIGGDMMRDWLHNSLGSLRNSVKQVSEVPEVPKLDKGSLKVPDIKQTVKVGNADITLESQDSFNQKITQLFV